MRFVQIGGVVLVKKELAVVIDIIDHNRVLVDGPFRGALNFKDCQITDLLVKVPRGAGTKTVKKVIEAEKLQEKWAATSWGQKLVNREKRKNLSDFDRFKLMIAKKQRRTVIGKQFAKLRRTKA